MSLFRNSNTALARQQAPVVAPGNGGQTERVQSQEWLNIGRVMVSCDDKNEITVTFVGLPFGLGIDTMQEAKGTGYLPQAKNALLEEVHAAFQSIGPGEEVILDLPEPETIAKAVNAGESIMLPGLYIQLRRVNDATSRPVSDNPFLAAMATNRFTVVK